MWKVDDNLANMLKETHTFVTELLDWALAHHKPGGNLTALRAEAMADTGNLGRVAQRTRLSGWMAELAVSPHLVAIRNDYRRITQDYKAFLDGGARLRLGKKAKAVAERVFRELYTDLLSKKTFWQVYDRSLGPSFTLATYRERFGALRKVCPYCDYNKVAVNATTDHFLAQEHVPVLAVFFQNMVPACSDCNSPTKGQTLIGTARGQAPSNVPIFHPYYDEAAAHFRFVFGKYFLPAGLQALDSAFQGKVDNYNRVFGIVRRYAEDEADLRKEANNFKDWVLSEFNNRSHTQPANRALLRTVVIELAKTARDRCYDERGKVAKVKVQCDLYELFEQTVDDLANTWGIP